MTETTTLHQNILARLGNMEGVVVLNSAIYEQHPLEDARQLSEILVGDPIKPHQGGLISPGEALRRRGTQTPILEYIMLELGNYPEIGQPVRSSHGALHYTRPVEQLQETGVDLLIRSATHPIVVDSVTIKDDPVGFMVMRMVYGRGGKK